MYAKAAAAIVAAGASAVLAALSGDQTISDLEWINILIAIAAAASVFAGPNIPGARATKFVLAAVMVALTAAVNFISDTTGPTNWWQLLIAAAGAGLVYAVRNSTETPPAAV
jgi:peptidoglycan/LPS O-acetylase OafA/YrhL